MMKRYALTAIGRDKPGIVAAVTKALFEHGCNIEDSSMTILEDEFAIILIMSKSGPPDALKKDLRKTEKDLGLTVTLKKIPKESASRAGQSNYIITLHGADKAGIVYRTAELLASMGVNITDLETKTVGEAGKKVYIMVLEVYAPKGADVTALEWRLEELARSLGVTVKIKPVEAYEPL